MENELKNGKISLEKIVYNSYSILFIIIVSVCIFGSGIYYSRKREVTFPEIVLLIMGLFFMITLAMLIKHIKISNNQQKGEVIIWVISISLMFFQIYCVWNYYFLTDWDVAIIFKASEIAAKGSGLEEFQYYFSRYPNNLLLVYIYGVLIRFFQYININYRMGILACQCVLSWGTGIILYFTVKDVLKNNNIAWFAWIVYLLLIGMSPWVSIPYSDSIGLIIPICIVQLYSQTQKRTGMKKTVIWMIIGFLTIIGYKIKPQIAIVSIAICILVCFNTWRDWKKLINIIISVVVGLVISIFISTLCINSLGVKINSDETYGLTHFLMMGMNYSEGAAGNGVYNSEDVEISASYHTAKERKEGNLRIAKDRIKEMGLSGMTHLMHRKILTNYNDGSFCWGGEGTFYIKLLSNKTTVFAKFLRNIYYNGKYYNVFYNFELMLWLTILVLGIIATIRSEKDPLLAIVMLSLIGLTVFELLFEARARYLYTYAPLYILLASAGTQKICERIDNK